MLNVGDLVVLLRSDGMGPVTGSPPAIIVKKYKGIPEDLQYHEQSETVYDILFNGNIEMKVAEEWLRKL